MLSSFDRAFVFVNHAVIGGLMLVMTVLVFVNVVLRYLAGFSLPWVEELSRYMMIWVAYLGAGLALRAGTHVAVELLQDMIPTTWARVLRTAIAALILVFLAAIAWYGFSYAQFAMRQTSPVLNVSLGVIYLGVPVGCVLAAAHLLLGLRRYIARDFDIPESVAETSPEILTLATHDGRKA